jgi:hypothetical protein
MLVRPPYKIRGAPDVLAEGSLLSTLHSLLTTPYSLLSTPCSLTTTAAAQYQPATDTSLSCLCS